MKLANLIRRSGAAAVFASMMLLISDILELLVFGFENVSTIAAMGVYAFITACVLLAALLLSLGLIGLYASQAEAAGFLGFLGFLMAFVGTLLFAGFFWAQEFFAPVVAEAAPDLLDNVPGWLYFGSVMTFSLFALGWLLFGVATFRARIYPRWAALLLMIGAVLIIFPLPVPSVVFDVAVAWLGLTLLRGRTRLPSGHPS